MLVPGNLLTDLPSHCHPAKALPLHHLTARALLAKFCLPLKVLVLHHLTAQALLANLCQLLKVLPLLAKFCLPR